MPTDPPIACTLTGQAHRTRLQQMADVGRDALLERDVDHATATLRFRPTESASGELRSIVAAEASCCAFLDLDLDEQPGAVVLRITGPAEAEPIVRELADAFAGRSAA